MTTESPPTELIHRTRKIDSRTERLMPLLDLLQEREGPSPLEPIREALIEVLVEQRAIREALHRLEQAISPRHGVSSATSPPRGR